jgi:lipoprotein NlpI
MAVKQYAEAVRDFDKALELKPGLPNTYMNRAFARYYAKEYDQAWADVEACKKLGGRPDPEFIRALSRESGRQ